MHVQTALASVLTCCLLSACASNAAHDATNTSHSAAGCTSAPIGAASILKDELPGGSSVSGLIAYPARLEPPSPVEEVQVVTATVFTALPGLKRVTLHPQWAYSAGRLFTLPGDAAIVTPHLPTLNYVGGVLSAVEAAAADCLSASPATRASTFTTSVPPLGDALRLSGAIFGVVHGHLSCVGSQASGTFVIGMSKVTLDVGDTVSATITRPPGGAPLWLFLPTPDPSRVTGIRLEANGVVFRTTIPYDDLTSVSRGTTPKSGLTLDGELPCD